MKTLPFGRQRNGLNVFGVILPFWQNQPKTRSPRAVARRFGETPPKVGGEGACQPEGGSMTTRLTGEGTRRYDE